MKRKTLSANLSIDSAALIAILITLIAALLMGCGGSDEEEDDERTRPSPECPDPNPRECEK